jgi:putative addiction module component (TIGR02574 family)
MIDLYSSLANQAQSLPPEDRARLAERLLASLDPHDTQAEAAWETELRKRIAEVESGAVTTLSAESVFAKVRSRSHQ